MSTQKLVSFVMISAMTLSPVAQANISWQCQGTQNEWGPIVEDMNQTAQKRLQEWKNWSRLAEQSSETGSEAKEDFYNQLAAGTAGAGAGLALGVIAAATAYFGTIAAVIVVGTLATGQPVDPKTPQGRHYIGETMLYSALFSALFGSFAAIYTIGFALIPVLPIVALSTAGGGVAGAGAAGMALRAKTFLSIDRPIEKDFGKQVGPEVDALGSQMTGVITPAAFGVSYEAYKTKTELRHQRMDRALERAEQMPKGEFDLQAYKAKVIREQSESYRREYFLLEAGIRELENFCELKAISP